jgi:uncharacterized repeat protein (TIGR03803 family)
VRTFPQPALAIILGAAMVSGCGGSQQPMAPGAMLQSHSVAQPRVLADRARTAQSSYQVLHSFTSKPDGRYPVASLIDVNGTLYSTTWIGGAYGYGTVFSITTSGVEKVVHSFGTSPDGQRPRASLLAAGGTLYGTTGSGGSNSRGAVFNATPSGSEKVLYSFRNKPDGRQPEVGMIGVGGTLYGTTQAGGHANDGTVFSITPSGTEKVLHSFGHGTDGIRPYAPLINVGGALYGTTLTGGAFGDGTVFTITTSGAERVLYSFKGAPDGNGPNGLVDVGGTLYGTTGGGGAAGSCSGAYGCGTVFSITSSGTEKILHSFGGSGDGARPSAGLIDVKGTLYGTTSAGGTYNSGYAGGTVFSISRSGKEQVLHSFGSSSDGAEPLASLIKIGGTLYGTSASGGTSNDGTVFALTP